MKRAGFTMIELIFVIVILGILSAVALPKFIGVSEQAKVAKITSYAGTLNRTTLPPYWSQSLSEGNNGSIASYDANITSDLSTPNSGAITTAISFATAKLESSGYTFTNGTIPTKIVGTWTLGTKKYDLACADGSETTAAICDVYSETAAKWLLKGNL